MEEAARCSPPLKLEGAAAPQLFDGLWAVLSTEEDNQQKGKGRSLAVKLEQPLQVLQVTGQAGEDNCSLNMVNHKGSLNMKDNKGSSFLLEPGEAAVKLEQPLEVIQVTGEDYRSLNMDNHKGSSFLLEPDEAAEPGSLNMCHVANGGLPSQPLTVHDDAVKETSQYEWDGLVGIQGDWVGMAEVMARRGDSMAVSEEARCDDEGWPGSAKRADERWPSGVDGVVFMAEDNYELQQHESMPKTETMLSGPFHEYSAPSVSGRIDVSSNGMAGWVGEIAGDPVTDGGGLWSKVSCAPVGGGSQSNYSGCVYDMADKAAEASQCQEAGLVGEGAVLCDGYNDCLPNSAKFDIQQLPHDMDSVLFKKDVKCELEQDVLLPKIEAEVSSPAHQDSAPSALASNLAVTSDGKAGGIGDHKTGIKKVACCSLGGGMLSRDSGFLKEAPGDEIQFPRMRGCHENRGLGHRGSSGVELGCPNHLAVENVKDEDLENQKPELSSVPRRRNPRRSASARIPTLERHDQMYKGHNSTCKPKKVESSCSLVESIMVKFPNKTTKVRSGINRPPKSTAWGSLQNLAGGFGQNCEPSTSNSHLNALENGRSRQRTGKKEQRSIRKTRSSRRSKSKFPPLSAIGFASGELNSQPIFSVTTGTYASSEGYVGNFPRFDHHELVNGSDDAHKTAECKSFQTGLQQLDRCLESVTQESCPAYIWGDFAKSTSEPSLNIAGVGFSPDSVLDVASATCENNTSANHDAAGITNGASVPQPPRAAWVCCDDCQKWRSIPSHLADIIGKTNCRWTCNDNQDKTFADCSIPQEKTNAEINAELDLSDASADEAENDGSNSKASKAPSWTHARINSFLHRNRRNQSIDESMVCNCKPPQDGRMGCRDGCLNRILNIECEKRTCPCGEQCSNQQFQRRSYAKISWFHSGKKGYGLQLQEDVSEGRFLIEYVGEVLDIMAYESRQRYYASKGQKHFYFMALNGGEVIDACTKGNLGRFINHSCSPNCRTEKWMVSGEVCIGIFAMRNIKKGEELTFDYNYVRVSGAAPQKCFCGTAKCRGYIGGDISGSGIIAQDDAEAQHFEPMVTYKDAQEMLGNAYCPHGANPNVVELETSIQREDSNSCPPATPDSEPHQQISPILSDTSEPDNSMVVWRPQDAEDVTRTPATPDSEPHQQISPILSDTSEPDNSMVVWRPQDAEDVTRTPVHVSRTIQSSLQQCPVYGSQPLTILEKTPNTIDELTALNVMNRSTPISDLGSSLVPGFHDKKKNSRKHHRNAKACPTDIGHALGVEWRLNSLLDQDGGIIKRKDSVNEYLRLLFMTAVGSDAGGIKRIRDLALILEALLKTKSGAVLLGIINMNGLQMLHNILKQNRDHFIRIPIIRKLLKVLEFLALRGILTAEKINEGPRGAEGARVESFRDSMLKLTRHSDKHVHLIARKFCDKWIHPYMGGPANCSTHSYSSGRKRKSRWDYQPESHYKMAWLQIGKVYSGHGELDLQISVIRNRSHGNWVTNSNHNHVPIMGSSTDGADDDVPPGFEPQQERQPAQASLDCGVAPGFCQERCLPNMSISYGIPNAIVQNIGTPEVEGTQCGKKWKVAPGVPFDLFPPLPTYPRGSPCPPSTLSTQMSHRDGASTMKHDSSGFRGRGADRGGRVHRNGRNGERSRLPYDQVRRSPSSLHRLER